MSKQKSRILKSDEEFSEIIYSIKDCTAAGQDGWSIRLLKAVFSRQPKCITVMRECLNMMFEKKFFPRCWFVEKMVVFPTFSKGSKIKTLTTLNVFRRIAASSLLKLYHSKLLSIIPQNEYSLQGRSGKQICSLVMTDLMDTFRCLRKPLILSKISFPSPFIFFNHDIFLTKLGQSHCPDIVVEFFRSSYNYRHIFGQVDDYNFDYHSPMNLPRSCPLSYFAYAIYSSSLLHSFVTTPSEYQTFLTSNECVSSSSSFSFTTPRVFLPSFISSPRTEITLKGFRKNMNFPLTLGYRNKIFLCALSFPEFEMVMSYLQRTAYNLGIILDHRFINILYLDENGNANVNYELKSVINNVSLKCNVQPHICESSSSSSSSSSFSSSLKQKPDVVQTFKRIEGEEGPVTAEQSIQFCSSIHLFGKILSTSSTEREHDFYHQAGKWLRVLMSARQLPLQHFFLIAKRIHVYIIEYLQVCSNSSKMFTQIDGIVREIVRATFGITKGCPLPFFHYPRRFGGLGIHKLSDIHVLSVLSLRKLAKKVNPILRTVQQYFKETFSNFFKHIPESPPANEALDFLLMQTDGSDDTVYAMNNHVGTIFLYNLRKQYLSSEHKKMIRKFGLFGLWQMLLEKRAGDLLVSLRKQSTMEMFIISSSLFSEEGGEWMTITPHYQFQQLKDWQVGCSMFYRVGVLPFPEMRQVLGVEQMCPLCDQPHSPFHFLECTSCSAILLSRHRQMVMFLSHFCSKIPDTRVTVVDKAVVKYSDSDYFKKPGIIGEISVSISNLSFDPSEEELALIPQRTSKNSIVFFIEPVIIPIYTIELEKTGFYTNAVSLHENNILHELETLEKSEVKMIIPFGISTSGELGQNAWKLLDYLENVCQTKSYQFPRDEFFSNLSLIMETSRATLLRTYVNNLKEFRKENPHSFLTTYPLPPECPLKSTALQRYNHRKRFSSEWTYFFSTFPHFQSSSSVIEIPRPLLLHPLPETESPFDKNKMEFENNGKIQQALLCSFLSTFQIPKKEASIIDLTSSLPT
jgi:hypothetical protein